MGNYNLFNNLVKEIPTNLRKFIVRKLRRFNLIPRAERIIEKIATERGERAPLPEKIQQQIDEVLKKNPELLKSVASERNITLLERLKKVFVISTGHNKDMFNKTRLTPIQYNLFKPDKIEEFKENIPEGKFSLNQAELFLKEFQRNPNMATVESLSERLKIESKQIMCMVTHTKVFKAVLPVNKKAEEKSYLSQVVESMVPSIIETEPDEEKIYRILDRRSTKFQRFYEEKIGIPQQNFDYVVKNPGLRKILVSMNIAKDIEPKIVNQKEDNLPISKEVPVILDEHSTTIFVNDLKPGEDPNAFEKLPEFSEIQKYGRMRTGDDPTGEVGHVVYHPDMDKFDVFKVMEEQDKNMKKEKRKRETLKKEEEKNAKEEKKVQKDEHKLLTEGQQTIEVRGKVSSENT